jgi:aldehyde:ferredoxin oxidoreductase
VRGGRDRWSDLTKAEAWEIGERITNLMRAFSVRRGHTPADDLDFGGRLLEAPASGVGKGKTVAPHLKEMLGEYYSLMGWDAETGVPKAEKLKELGLEDVAKDLAGIEVKGRLSEVTV